MSEPTDLSDREKVLVRKAFLAGSEYEASLFSDVLNTIIQQVRKYRAATAEVKPEELDD